MGILEFINGIPTGSRVFHTQGHVAGIIWTGSLAKDATVSAEGKGFESFTLSHNVSSEQEVDEVVSQAVQAGATLVKKPQKVFWGVYSGYFKDIDGHLWEAAHNPLFWIGPVDEDA
jgi:uncharacterized glyoxalase superfamily protein PhnB